MKYALHKLLIGPAFALVAAGAGAADGPMSKDAYEQAGKRIEQQRKAERKACGRLKSNARDICRAEADGREKVAKAKLEARYRPGPEPERQAKDAKTEADYEIAKEKCDLAQGIAEDACRQQARDAREAALRLAKVEKVERINELKAEAKRRR